MTTATLGRLFHKACWMLLGIVVVSGCSSPIPSVPPFVKYKISAEERAALRPEVRELVNQIENGSINDWTADQLATVLKRADMVDKRDRITEYYFAADGYQGDDLEGHPVIYIAVENDSSRILNGAIYVPSW